MSYGPCNGVSNKDLNEWVKTLYRSLMLNHFTSASLEKKCQSFKKAWEFLFWYSVNDTQMYTENKQAIQTDILLPHLIRLWLVYNLILGFKVYKHDYRCQKFKWCNRLYSCCCFTQLLAAVIPNGALHSGANNIRLSFRTHSTICTHDLFLFFFWCTAFSNWVVSFRQRSWFW